jgi:tRNA A-37 threonylcarbamoyl transferase component Bud32
MVGRLLDGRYQIRARIARGGMATVYLATDLRLERRVAVKIMHAHLADDAAFRDRFIQEARSAARLAHPNVVNVFDQGQDLGTAYLVMEYLQGITLRDLLGEYGRLTPEQTMDILEAVLAGLVAAHKAGIIHRDLKPENVLLADDGRIKIGDFGLARAATSHTASGQALLGTIAYLSPELVTRGIADTRSDVYAVGIMMFEMLTGEQPFKGEQPVQIAYQHANDSVPAPSSKNPGVPALLDDLTLWATSRDPEDRPRDARAMLDQLFETQHLMAEGAEDARRRPTTQRTAVIPPTAETRLLTTDDLGTGASRRAAPRRSAPADAVERLRIATAKAHRRGAWAFGAVLVAGAMAAGTGWYYGGGPGSTSALPAVRGMTQNSAAAQLTSHGFRLGAPKTVWSATDAGTVTTTVPTPGTALAPGATVSLVLSKGAQPTSAPTVKGRTIAAATAAVTAARLTLAGRVDRASTRAAGSVVRLIDANGDSVPAGTELPAGAAVRLVVSTGPAVPVDAPLQ